MRPDGYLPRLVDPAIDTGMRQAPIIVLTGPRGAGKSATMARRAAEVAYLGAADDSHPMVRDPDAAIAAAPKPLLLDEWHNIPQLTGALKRAVLAGAPPGSFLLTSYAEPSVGEQQWPGVGHVAHVEMYPMTMREMNSTLGTSTGLERVLGLREHLPRLAQPAPQVGEYAAAIARGGLPAAAAERSDRVRESWTQFYLSRLVDRDVPVLGRRPDPYLFGSYLRLLARYTGQVPPDRLLYSAIGVSRDTQMGYEALVEQVGLSRPARSAVGLRLRGNVQRERVFLTDTALALGLALVGASDMVASRSMFQRMLATFVAMQLRAEIAQADAVAPLGYARSQDGTCEVDLVIDAGQRGVAGVVVEPDAAASESAVRSLEWMKGRMGPRWLGGVVAHVGSQSQRLADDIAAVPAACLWDELAG